MNCTVQIKELGAPNNLPKRAKSAQKSLIRNPFIIVQQLIITRTGMLVAAIIEGTNKKPHTMAGPLDHLYLTDLSTVRQTLFFAIADVKNKVRNNRTRIVKDLEEAKKSCGL